MLRILLALALSAGVATAKPITIGLIGDSTVAQQSGWGPAFAGKFTDGVVVHNHAVNGATLEALSKPIPKLLTRIICLGNSRGK